MNGLKKNYEIVAIGNIQLRTKNDSKTDEILARNREAIEEIWKIAQKEKGGKLFNGTLPNFIRVDKKLGRETEITCHFVEYKSFLSQRKQPALKLGIKPIGVSGIIILEENGNKYVVFAKRGSDTTEYPGFLELAPSGSIDKECADLNGIVDYQSKLLSEFEEETGLSKKRVKDISGFALVLDVDHNVYDICCEIILLEKRQSVAAEFVSKEYKPPVFVDMKDLNSFIKTNSSSIVPTSMALIAAYEQNQKD